MSERAAASAPSASAAAIRARTAAASGVLIARKTTGGPAAHGTAPPRISETPISTGGYDADTPAAPDATTTPTTPAAPASALRFQPSAQQARKIERELAADKQRVARASEITIVMLIAQQVSLVNAADLAGLTTLRASVRQGAQATFGVDLGATTLTATGFSPA
jgi:pyruvate/2-oxoglutarate dehydrogenase complex dihydrolipoamide acyltransferase (E2) component